MSKDNQLGGLITDAQEMIQIKKQIPEKIPNSWPKIMKMHVRTSQKMALPWSKVQEQLKKFTHEGASPKLIKTYKKTRILFEKQMESTKAFGVKHDPVVIEGVKCEWTYWSQLQNKNETKEVILYLHGGAYIVGSPKSHRATIARLAQKTGMVVLAVDYPLAPEHSWPNAVEDVLKVFHWLQRIHGCLPEKIVFGGDSAGGGLCLATMLALRDAKQTQPAGAVLFYPWGNLTDEFSKNRNSSRWRNRKVCSLRREILAFPAYSYAGGIMENVGTSQISPALVEDLSGLPKLFIQVGSFDALLDDSFMLKKNADKSNVSCTLQVLRDLPHGWHGFAKYVPSVKKSFNAVGDFVSSLPALQSQKPLQLNPMPSKL